MCGRCHLNVLTFFPPYWVNALFIILNDIIVDINIGLDALVQIFILSTAS